MAIRIGITSGWEPGTVVPSFKDCFKSGLSSGAIAFTPSFLQSITRIINLITTNQKPTIHKANQNEPKLQERPLV